MDAKRFTRDLLALNRVYNAIRMPGPQSVSAICREAGVSPSVLDGYIDCLRDELGAPIAWNDLAKRYFLTTRWSLAKAIARLLGASLGS